MLVKSNVCWEQTEHCLVLVEYILAKRYVLLLSDYYVDRYYPRLKS